MMENAQGFADRPVTFDEFPLMFRRSQELLYVIFNSWATGPLEYIEILL